eukprot:727175-Rhodomonas_salina.1
MQTNIHTNRHTDRETHKHKHRDTVTNTDTHKHTQTHRHTGTNTDRQTHTHTQREGPASALYFALEGGCQGLPPQRRPCPSPPTATLRHRLTHSQPHSLRD